MKNETNERLKNLHLELAEATERVNKHAELIAVGRSVRIVSNYNGQHYGKSRKSLRGKIVRVTGVHVNGDDVYLLVQGTSMGTPR